MDIFLNESYLKHQVIMENMGSFICVLKSLTKNTQSWAFYVYLTNPF